MNPRAALLAFFAFACFIVLSGSLYTVKETETAVITQFGRPVGKPVTDAGLYFKIPFIQTVNRIEKRVLEWDGPANEMPTKDKTYVEVNAFARWRIADPGLYFVGLRDERSALSRLEDIIGSEVRAAVASHELIEIIRSEKGRTLTEDPQKKGAGAATVLPVVKRGRLEIEKDILAAAALKLAPLGLELLDVRIKRVNYNAQVLDRIYKRMISERQQIAQRFRSEGEGEAARILGKKDRDLREVESTAYKQVQQVQGEADAEASRIYAEAYNQSPAAAEFYGFLKTLETYRKILGPGTSVIFSTDSDLFRLLKKSQPAP
jgi:membrane protease subunit HflC